MLTRGLVCAALVAGVVSVAPPAMGGEPRPRMPQICRNEINASERMHADVSELASNGVLSLDGRTIRVHGDDAQWRQYQEGDQTYVARFHSMQWLVLAQQAGYPAVDLLLERDAALPDPGSNASDKALKSTGWTEGAVRLRMGTVSCLYEWTGDERLIPLAERLVLASADPYRYRGLPLKKAHNHGTLANIVLAETAKVFGRDDWWELAIRRFANDASAVFSNCGMTFEQSAPYQLLNLEIWQRSLRLLEEEGNRTATVVREALARASLATAQLTRPDGILEAVGDGNDKTIDPASVNVDTSTAGTRLWCQQRGWAANRSSWDDTATHYVLRFGPRVALHGHDDHGSMTWYSQGVSVFADRGLFDKTRGSRYEWARSKAAHNTFEPVGIDTTKEMVAEQLSNGRTDRYVLDWSEGQLSSTRDLSLPLDPVLIPAVAESPPTDDTTVTVDDSTVVDDTVSMLPMTSLRVTDVGRSRREQQWMQNWQLALGWTVLPRTNASEPVAYHEKSGLYLYGTCYDSLFMAPTRQTVEAFPKWRTSVPATAFVCGGLGREVKIDTLWVVTPLKGTLQWDRSADAYTVAPPPPLPPLPPIPSPA